MSPFQLNKPSVRWYVKNGTKKVQFLNQIFTPLSPSIVLIRNSEISNVEALTQNANIFYSQNGKFFNKYMNT